MLDLSIMLIGASPVVSPPVASYRLIMMLLFCGFIQPYPLHRVPNVSLFFPSSTFILFFSAPCGYACVTLVSPSGPHWGLRLSSADNYCHLHIVQFDKHLTLPVASHRIAVLVEASLDLVEEKVGKKNINKILKIIKRQ